MARIKQLARLSTGGRAPRKNIGKKAARVPHGAKRPPTVAQAKLIILFSERSDIKKPLFIGGEERNPFAIHTDSGGIHPCRVSRPEFFDPFGSHITDIVIHCIRDEVTFEDAFKLGLTESQPDRRVYDEV